MSNKAVAKKFIKATNGHTLNGNGIHTNGKIVATTIKKITPTNKKKQAQPKKKSTLINTHYIFQLKYRTTFGQQLFITGNHPLLGNNDITKALPMQYLNEEWWTAGLDFNEIAAEEVITYNYVLRNTDGNFNLDWGKDKTIKLSAFKTKEVIVKDAWNFAGYYQNTFYTEPFQKVLLATNDATVKTTIPKKTTHQFKIKAPLIGKDETVCLCGSGTVLKEWDTKAPLLMQREEGNDCFTIHVDLRKAFFPIAYKYGVFNVKEKKIIRFEEGNNRLLYDEANNHKTVIVNDGFAALPSTQWKGAGVAIPVFSLRSEKSFGVGEFTDLKLLVDWSKQTGLKLIQLLPVNDTIATHTWVDSYPYSAISAFALHPMFLNLQQLVGKKYQSLLDELEEERKHLNALPDMDYEAAIKIKIAFINQVFPLLSKTTFASKDYTNFFEQNKQWLVPYAAFSYLRDEYGTADFNQWPAYKKYDATAVEALIKRAVDKIAIHYFIQYHLHIQLKEATEYAHQNGIIVKGDIPIGVYRFGADAWQHSELYNMCLQAGAPPDDFAVKGQNWGFPTYNWQRMKEDGYAWWKQRFEQMSYYFDAFRIDHILGFFRIWSIPMHAVEGIMGHFVPAIPVHVNEFNQRNIWFNYKRYTKPFITEQVLHEIFNEQTEFVKNNFLSYDGFDNYVLKNEFDTQRKVENYFALSEDNEINQAIKIGLFNLISNIILFEVEGSQGMEFHFRFAMNGTSSFKNLEIHIQQALSELYINYFFRRQDDYWMKEALQKLPALKRVTNMLVCGEDLGLVPSCVPEVMKQLGLLSLEIQRMPKDSSNEFFHPNDAPYLSVVTPSTHDMSTIRGWWEEDRNKIQRFYNNQLGRWGDAPNFCDAWINKVIVLQHLYSPAMWSIFQLQDLMGMDETVRTDNPDDERINIPANPKNYWKYRMHLSLEDLLHKNSFNAELKESITASGR